jgi:undecaprenyl-diphosphatase
MMHLNTNVFKAFAAHEWHWCERANQRAHGTRWVPFFGFFSRIGDGVVWYLLMALLIVFGGTRGALAALHMAAIGLASLGLYKLVKGLSKRPRPLMRRTGLHLSVAPLDEFSFPSGHTLHAVGFSLVACHYFPWLALILVPLSLCIAISRVVLGLHYPSDVAAAVLMGAGLYWLALRWLINSNAV